MKILYQNDVWDSLAKSEKPIVMYGMGNGADKILSVFDDHSIKVEDFFASDGFVRGHSFHSKRVLSYSEIKEKYGVGNYTAVMSFASSRDDVLDNVKKISSECDFYLPDVPVSGDELFDYPFYENHKSELQSVYDLLCDDESKRLYENIVNYKLSGKIDYLFDSESDEKEAMDLISASSFKVYADFGAYNGDSIRNLLSYSDLEKVFAVEPDPHSFKKLSEYAQSETKCKVIPINAGVYSENKILSFDKSGNRNANFNMSATNRNSKMTDVSVVTPDFLLKDEKSVDFIKYDVEGSEFEAIKGTKETIDRLSPALLVSIYHRSRDLFELPLLIKSICPSYRLYIRRFRGVPAWDINLYCVK